MRKLIIVLLLLILNSTAEAQINKESNSMPYQTGVQLDDQGNVIDPNQVRNSPADSVVTIGITKEATFLGGVEAFNHFVEENFQYPTKCAELGINGDVLLKFVVEKDGSITHVTVLKQTQTCPEFTDEAIHIIRRSPRWIPAQKNGKYVRSYQTVPIKLRLNE